MAQAGTIQRALSLFSEGTKLAAEIMLLASPPSEHGYLAILLCHGWGRP